jgi:type I restriction enzyme S subunit
MKHSGVEWIGEIPEHWFCVGTNKVYQDLGTGTTPTSDNKDYYMEDGFHWITTTDLNEGIMYDTLTKISNKSIIDYPNLRLYPSGSIYISMYGGRIGKLGISTFDSYCNQSVCVLPKNDKINVKFYYYWFLGFQELVKNMGRGGGQPNINKEMIKQFPTVKIELIEQNEIVEYLDFKTKEIDDLVDLEKKKIDLLKEYRQSLISEVVTGKIKVTTDE